MSIGLAVWSAMTAVSGFASTFTQLALARVGVGIGEASASPAGYSLLSDCFPARRRATVLALYQSGIHIGSGLGLCVGGLVVTRWDAAWGGAPPFGLRGWQVAFFVVGLPGLLLALGVRLLREPVRGAADGIVVQPHPHPFRAFGRELRAVLPPLGLLHLWLERASAATFVTNLAAAATLSVGAWLLTQALGNPIQWICLAVGCDAAVSWAQALRLRDPVTFTLLLRTPSLRAASLAFACLAAAGYGMSFWTAPFFIRVHHVGEAEAGLVLGTVHALAGWVGVALGGVLADRWRERLPAGRLCVPVLTATLAIPLALGMLTTNETRTAYLFYVPLSVSTGLWAGGAVSTIQDLVLPRMRGTASAAYLLLVTLVGLALGPFAIGRLSVGLGDLRAAMCCGLVAYVGALVFLVIALRGFARDESTLRDRARAAGEVGM
jgi:MFS family permease